MIFIYKQWEDFCRKLNNSGLSSVPAAVLLSADCRKPFLILKHDVENNPIKALKLARIESKYNHKGSYYVQAYLLGNKKNIEILKRIQELGHEISYHHDVMDSNIGDIEKALKEFQRNIEVFQCNGFSIKTVCQHGNPIVDRRGYSSNRDFFRSTRIAQLYGDISDIMVNFKNRLNQDYLYVSDAGYGWKIIFDPENNDVVKSDHRDIRLDNLNEIIRIIEENKSVIISTHPHRWNKNGFSAQVSKTIFRTIRAVAKGMLKLPYMNKLMGRFYFIAKRI